jgi:hypothetical protein
MDTTSATAPGNDKGFTGLGEIDQQIVGLRIADNGAWRDFNDEVFAVPTGFLLSPAMGAVLSPELPLEPKWIQRPPTRSALQDDISALAAVAAIRASPGYVLLAPKTYAAFAAVPGLNGNKNFINEFHSA